MLLNYHIGRFVLVSLCVGDLVRLGLSSICVAGWITMMHGPINIRFYWLAFICFRSIEIRLRHKQLNEPRNLHCVTKCGVSYYRTWYVRLSLGFNGQHRSRPSPSTFLPFSLLAEWPKVVAQSVTFPLSRSRWLRGLRRRSAAAPLLISRVRIPLREQIFVSCVRRVLSFSGLCDKLTTGSEESYRVLCVVLCDLETSTMTHLRLLRHRKTSVNQELQFRL